MVKQDNLYLKRGISHKESRMLFVLKESPLEIFTLTDIKKLTSETYANQFASNLVKKELLLRIKKISIYYLKNQIISQ